MSSITPRNINPSKPVVVVRRNIPTFSFNNSSNYKSGLGHGETEDNQVMLLHDVKSYNNGDFVLQQGSVLVASDDGNYEFEALQKDHSGREKLKRHREEAAAGRVLIPDKWGKEELLKEWIDYSSFDSLLAPNGVASARKALMAEGRRRTASQRLKI